MDLSFGSVAWNLFNQDAENVPVVWPQNNLIYRKKKKTCGTSPQLYGGQITNRSTEVLNLK